MITMPKKIRYEVSGWGSDTFHETLATARKLAKQKARACQGIRFVAIYKLSIPGCRNCKTTLVEKWGMNKSGKLFPSGKKEH